MPRIQRKIELIATPLLSNGLIGIVLRNHKVTGVCVLIRSNMSHFYGLDLSSLPRNYTHIKINHISILEFRKCKPKKKNYNRYLNHIKRAIEAYINWKYPVNLIYALKP